jgi:hypothetical protein
MQRMNTRRIAPTNWYAIRWFILERDQFTCQYCGQYAPNVRLEVDHKLAVCEGGSDEMENLTTACWACNMGKEGYRAHVAGRAGTQRRDPAMRERLPTLPDRIADFLIVQNEATAKEIASALGVKQDVVRVAIHRGYGTRFTSTQRVGGVLTRYRLTLA